MEAISESCMLWQIADDLDLELDWELNWVVSDFVSLMFFLLKKLYINQNFDDKDGKYSIEHCMVCQINEDLLVEDGKFSESERLARWCMAWQVDEDLEDLKEVSVIPIQVSFTNINTFP